MSFQQKNKRRGAIVYYAELKSLYSTIRSILDAVKDIPDISQAALDSFNLALREQSLKPGSAIFKQWLSIYHNMDPNDLQLILNYNQDAAHLILTLDNQSILRHFTSGDFTIQRKFHMNGRLIDLVTFEIVKFVSHSESPRGASKSVRGKYRARGSRKPIDDDLISVEKLNQTIEAMTGYLQSQHIEDNYDIQKTEEWGLMSPHEPVDYNPQHDQTYPQHDQDEDEVHDE